MVPGTYEPAMVDSSVCGIRLTPTTSSSIEAIVRLVRSMEIEPLRTQYSRTSGGTRTLTQRALPSVSDPITSPTPSMCPCTRCPPTSSPYPRAGSRLTRAPAPRPPRPVRLKVSGMTSALKTSPSIEAAVRHTPLTAMLPPSLARRRLSGARTRTTPSSTTSMVPTSATIPENISDCPATSRRHRLQQHVVSEHALADEAELKRAGEVGEALTSDGGNGVAAAHQLGRQEGVNLVDGAAG